ncbi:MAG: hypothetical protein AAF321_07955, partial [Pseudomonadota bacterium]
MVSLLSRKTSDAPQPITTRTLDKAVEQGILTRLQVAELKELAGLVPAEPVPTAGAAPDRPRDPENLRFIGGFGDIFVTIGLLLFLGALSQMIGALDVTSLVTGRVADATATGVVMAASWVLAEYFTRIRRMALPSIVLLLIFVAAGFGVLQALALTHVTPLLSDWLPAANATAGALLVAGLGAALLAGLHYWRFRVPITVAAGVAALSLGIAGILGTTVPDVLTAYPTLTVGAFGVSIFLLAMRFDLRDPARVTRNTDIAFWLHLLAAPLIVRAVLPAAGGEGFSTDWIFTAPTSLETGTAVLVLVLFLALGLVSVLIDRRALLVAGLSFAGVAYWSVLQAVNLSEDNGVVVTLLS